MTVKKFIKAFVAGMAFPAIAVPIVYTILYFNFRSPLTAHALQFVPMFLPIVWGFANAIYAQMQTGTSAKAINRGLIVTGACLGFLVACFGVFVINLPTVMFGEANTVRLLPLILVPIVYALLWRFVVKWFNKIIGV